MVYIELLPLTDSVRATQCWKGTAVAFLMNRLSYVNGEALRGLLWQAALDTAAPLEFEPGCAHFLRGWIAMGVERMVMTDRLAPPDLALARANIRTFVELMKSEAVFLGQPSRLDKGT